MHLMLERAGRNMIPDYLFEEGLNNTYLENDMKHVAKPKQLYEMSQKDYVSLFNLFLCRPPS